MMKIKFLAIFLLIQCKLFAQFNSRIITGIDFYHWLNNPELVGDSKHNSVGSVFPLIVGAELLFGKSSYSLGLEAQTNLSLFAFDVNEYKGIGAVSFPFMLKLNYGSLSGFGSKLFGISLGGGLQYNRTELIRTSKNFKNLERSFFPTTIGEINVGVGLSGIVIAYYVRIGNGKEHSMSFNTGLTTRINLINSNKSLVENRNQNKI
ncbi:MAG: hypothetical protein ABI851_07370 [Saprospiraceae bacterium]